MKRIPVIIALVLFFLPFVWFRGGGLDLGGDSSRLYFYDPIAYLSHYSLFSVSPSGFGAENIGFYSIPIVFVFAAIRSLGVSATSLVAGFHGVSIALMFYATYAVCKEILAIAGKKENDNVILASISGALLYTLSPVMTSGWDKVLFTHNQVFLHPIVFYLLLRYVVSDAFVYLVGILTLSFVFTPNFSLVAAPPLAAFLPISVAVLVGIRRYVIAKPFQLRYIGAIFAWAFVLHSFHLIPQIVSMFSQGSVLNDTIFSTAGKIDRGLTYFLGIVTNIKLSYNLLALPQMIDLQFLHTSFAIVCMMIIAAARLVSRESATVKRVYALFGGALLIILFFASANITNIGLSVYKALFMLPGFSIFRNFYGQWAPTLVLYTSLVFAFSSYIVLSNVRRLPLFFGILLVGLCVQAWPFLSGSSVNPYIWKSRGMRIITTFPRDYEQALSYVSALPKDGKVLTLPLTDPGYQIVAGNNSAAYQGPSTISYLSGIQDFAGASELGVYEQEFLEAVRQKNIPRIHAILQLLGIRYIFYSADPNSYDAFPTFPYERVREFFPQTQKEYASLIASWKYPLLASFGERYFVYEIPDSTSIVTSASTVRVWGNGIGTSRQLDVYEKDPDSADIALSKTDMPYGARVTKTSIQLRPNDSVIGDFFASRAPSPYPSPFVMHAPSWFLYRLVRLQEDVDLWRAKKDTDVYINKALFYAEKRINEAKRWTDTLAYAPIRGSVDEYLTSFTQPDISDASQWNVYNSWHAYLASYYQLVHGLDEYLSNPHESVYSDTVNKRHIFSILATHKTRFEEAVFDNRTLTEDEKRRLLDAIHAMFDSLTDAFVVPVPDVSQLTYELPFVPSSGNYTAWLQDRGLKDSELMSFSLVHGSVRTGIANPSVSGWAAFSPIPVSATKEPQTLSLVLPASLNIYANSWVDASQLIHNGDVSSLFQESPSQNPLSGIFQRVDEWSGGHVYIVQFEYTTHGEAFDLNVFEKTKSSRFYRMHQDRLVSKQWKTYRGVFKTGEEAVAGLVSFSKAQDRIENVNASDTKHMDVRSFFMQKIPSPTITVELDQSPEKTTVPDLTVSRVNPSLYRIAVHAATDPYMLIVKQAFDPHWQLRLASSPRSDSSYVAVVFNALRSLVFRNADVVRSAHVKVDGYANGWYITPSDVAGKTDYVLYAQTTTQSYFYLGALISCVGALMLLFWWVGWMIRTGKEPRVRDWLYFYSLARYLKMSDVVYDMGCGAASPIANIKKTWYAVGVDAFEKSIKESQKKHIHDEYIRCNLVDIGKRLPKKSADTVLLLDVVEHLTKKDALAVMSAAERIARKWVIVLTPNGFTEQHEYAHNPWQVHKSGWTATDFKTRGYTVRGLRGAKFIRGEYATIYKKPWIFWAIAAVISELLLYFFPQFSYHIFAVKRVEQ